MPVRHHARRRLVLPVVAALALGALAACSSSGAPSDGRISLVASTDVWGDVARQVAGAAAQVTSVVDDPAADPHSYEPTARDKLELSRARVVVVNGGGYDDPIEQVVTSLEHRPTVLDAVAISGRRSTDGAELNEHVWYDVATVRAVAARIATAVTSAAPQRAADVRAGLARFDAALQGLDATTARVRAVAAGDGAAVTEPVPLYLLEACGFVDRTPPAFSQAVEAGDDVPPGVLADTLDLFRDHRVRLLVYNAQTSGAETEKAIASARAAHVPVVAVTETLPADEDYQTWMAANLAAFGRAVGA